MEEDSFEQPKIKRPVVTSRADKDPVAAPPGFKVPAPPGFKAPIAPPPGFKDNSAPAPPPGFRGDAAAPGGSHGHGDDVERQSRTGEQRFLCAVKVWKMLSFSLN
jgi:hypothetical protein